LTVFTCEVNGLQWLSRFELGPELEHFTAPVIYMLRPNLDFVQIRIGMAGDPTPIRIWMGQSLTVVVLYRVYRRQLMAIIIFFCCSAGLVLVALVNTLLHDVTYRPQPLVILTKILLFRNTNYPYSLRLCNVNKIDE
jgi:hypothetical protein